MAYSKWTYLCVLGSWLLGSIVVQGQVATNLDCGLDCVYLAASLYQDDLVHFEKLRSLVGPPSSQGYSLQQLQDLALKLDLFAKSVKLDSRALASIVQPCVIVLHVRDNHFVLLVEKSHSGFKVFDPTAEGFRGFDPADWTGYALIIADREIDLDSKGDWKWPLAVSLSMTLFLILIVAYWKWGRHAHK